MSYAQAKERKFIGSTPADPVIRTFFNIPLTDSIDFIRWNLILRDHEYQLKSILSGGITLITRLVRCLIRS